MINLCGLYNRPIEILKNHIIYVHTLYITLKSSYHPRPNLTNNIVNNY